MDINIAAKKRGSQPRKRRWRRVAFGILAIIFFGIIGLELVRLWVNRDVAALEATIRAKGEPVTLAELDAFYSDVPEEENAALVYLRAATLLAEIDEAEPAGNPNWQLKPRFEDDTFSQETLEQARRYLARRASVLSVSEEAQALTRSRYPIDLNVLPWKEQKPGPLTGLRALGTLIWMQGFVSLEDRDWEGFAENQRALIHFGSTIAEIPGEQNAYTVYTWRFASELLERAIPTGEVPPTLYEAVLPLYADLDIAATMYRNLLGKRVLHAHRLYREHLGQVFGYRSWIPGARTMAALDRLRGLRFYTAMLEDREKPWRQCFRNAIERQPFVVEWERKSEDPKRILEDSYPVWKRLSYQDDGTFVTRSLTYGEEIVRRLHPEMHAPLSPGAPAARIFDPTVHLIWEELQRRCLLLAMHIDSYRQRTGRIPYSIDLLSLNWVNEGIGDPFADGPLQYRRESDGFLVYSVGEDLKDDGGERPADFCMDFVPNTREIPEKDPPPAPPRGNPLLDGRRTAKPAGGEVL